MTWLLKPEAGKANGKDRELTLYYRLARGDETWIWEYNAYNCSSLSHELGGVELDKEFATHRHHILFKRWGINGWSGGMIMIMCRIRLINVNWSGFLLLMPISMPMLSCIDIDPGLCVLLWQRTYYPRPDGVACWWSEFGGGVFDCRWRWGACWDESIGGPHILLHRSCIWAVTLGPALVPPPPWPWVTPLPHSPPQMVHRSLVFHKVVLISTLSISSQWCPWGMNATHFFKFDDDESTTECCTASVWRSSLKTGKRPRPDRTITDQDWKFSGPIKTVTAVQSSVHRHFGKLKTEQRLVLAVSTGLFSLKACSRIYVFQSSK